MKNKEFRASGNSRAERGRLSDNPLLRARAHPRGAFYFTGKNFPIKKAVRKLTAPDSLT